MRLQELGLVLTASASVIGTSALANGPNPPPPARPSRATTAGYLLIIVGAVGLLVGLFLSLQLYWVGVALNEGMGGNGGLQEPTNPVVYLGLALPVAFFLAEIASGILVLRRRHGGRVAALIISCLAISVGIATLMVFILTPSEPLAVETPFVALAGVHVVLINLLESNDTRQWCRRTHHP
jgi:hypothetical protein